jgi:hypothetical protein
MKIKKENLVTPKELDELMKGKLELLTSKQFSQRLGMQNDQVLRKQRSTGKAPLGNLPYVKLGRKILYSVEALRSHWVNQKKGDTIKNLHEEWAIKNGYQNNDGLNSKNTLGFKDGAER